MEGSKYWSSVIMRWGMDRWDSPHYETWLASIPDVAARQVEAGVFYLFEHGRGAMLPDVRHRIQISKHFPNMSEVRVLHHANPHDLILRLLTSFVDGDNTLLVLVGDHIISWYLTNGTQR